MLTLPLFFGNDIVTNTEGSETGYGFVNMGVSACDDVCLKSVFIVLRERCGGRDSRSQSR